MKYIKNAVKNSYFVLFFSVFGIFIGYLLRIFLSRSLTLEDFGLFYAVSAFIGLFTLVRYLGLNQALTKFIPEFLIKKDDSRIKSSIASVFIIQSITILLFTAFVFLFQEPLTESLFRSDKAATVLILMTLSFFPSMFFTVFQSVFQGYQKLKTFAAVEPVRISLTFFFSVLLIPFGVVGISMAYLVAAIVTTFLFLYNFYNLNILKAKTSISQALIKKLLKFSIPVFVSSIALIIINFTDTLVITFFRSLEEVALYQVALPTSQLLLVFSGAITAVTFPLTSHLYSSRKLEEIRKGIRVITVMMLLLLLPFVIAIFSFPEIIIEFLFGSKFILASNSLQILAIGMIFYSIFVIFQTTLDGIGRPFVNTKIMFLMAAFNFAINIVLVPIIGIMGSAVAFLASFLVGSIAGFKYTRKYLNITLSFSRISKIFGVAIVSAIVMFSLKTYLQLQAYEEFMLVLFIGWSIFLIGVIMSKSITRDDIEFIESKDFHIPSSIKKAAKLIFRKKKEVVS